jgi:hypothetical protein
VKTTLGVRVIGGAIAATLLTAAVVSVASAAAGSHGTIHGCVGKQGALRVVAGHKCGSKESALSWAARGPKGARGPAGAPAATAFYSLNPSYTAANSSDTRAFLGTPATVLISNPKTAVFVTASLDFSSVNGAQLDSFFEVCYRHGSDPIQLVSEVEPNFTAPTADYITQSVSGVVGNLATGLYTVGICSAAEVNTRHGLGTGTVEVVQTTGGVSQVGGSPDPLDRRLAARNGGRRP